MIDNEFFVREMGKLIEQFGEKKFSQRKSQLIHQVVKNLDPKELTLVIDDIVGNMKWAPSVQEIRDVAHKYVSNTTKETPVDCSYCKGYGIINVRKKSGEVGEYGFRCTCKNGKGFAHLPPWRDSYRKEFTMQIVSIELTRKFYGLKSKETI